MIGLLFPLKLYYVKHKYYFDCSRVPGVLWGFCGFFVVFFLFKGFFFFFLVFVCVCVG